MNMEVLNYQPSRSEHVFAFVDLQLGPLRINGINLYRDGTITAGMLVYYERGKKNVRPAIELEASHPLHAEIRAAIEAYAAKLPPQERQPPALSPEEKAARKAKHENWLKQQAAKSAAAKAAKAAKRKAATPPGRPKWPARPAAPQPAPPRAKIEPGQPLIRRPR